MKRTLLTLAVTSLLVTTAFADPIHDAAKTGDLAGVQAELDKGVDANTKGGDAGVPPLLWAALMGHVEVAELLIANGADVDGTDKYGNTPLHYAAHHGRKETTKLLITKGADVNVKRDNGKTPLDNAKHYPEVVDLIRKHGGKTSAELALMPRLSFTRSPFGFTFNTIEGKTYRVESGMDLKKWTNLREIEGTGNEMKFIDVRRVYFPQHFYRVKVVE